MSLGTGVPAGTMCVQFRVQETETQGQGRPQGSRRDEEGGRDRAPDRGLCAGESWVGSVLARR